MYCNSSTHQMVSNGNGQTMLEIQQALTASLSVLIQDSIRIAKKLLSSNSGNHLTELPQTINFNTDFLRVNRVHSTHPLHRSIQDMVFRIQMMNVDLCRVIAMWFLIQDASIRTVYWSIQELVTDIVSLLMDLEYEQRIRSSLGLSEKEKMTIRDESMNLVLNNHKDELNEMLHNLNLVKDQETLMSLRISEVHNRNLSVD